jgi:pimeloyl-ACP methyl ester carboxylesterase
MPRGGRPDLASEYLPAVSSPTLLVVGGEDKAVMGDNREALTRLAGPKKLVAVPGATHLFPEPGALEEVSRLAIGWFAEHLTTRDPVLSSSGID